MCEYKYYIFDTGNKNNAIEFENGPSDALGCIAEMAAYHHWIEAGVEAKWPIILVLVNDKEQESFYQIEIEYNLVFNVSEC